MKLRLVSATLGIAIVAQTSCSPTVGSGAAALSGAPQSRQVPGIEGVIRVVRLVSAIVFPGQNLITAQILSKYFVSRNGTTQPEFMKIAARFSTAVSGTVDDLSGAKADTAIRAALRDFGLSAEGMIQAGGTQRTLVSVCRQIFALGKLLSFVNLPWLKKLLADLGILHKQAQKPRKRRSHCYWREKLLVKVAAVARAVPLP